MKREKEYRAALKRLSEVRNGLIETILRLPDNPEIERLAPRCYVLKSRQLQNNWSAEYYDFPLQYQRVADEVRKASAENLLNRLREILKEGKIVVHGNMHSAQYTFKLNPAVVTNIAQAVGLEEEICGA